MLCFRVIVAAFATFSFLPTALTPNQGGPPVTRKQAPAKKEQSPAQTPSAKSVRPGMSLLQAGSPDKALAYCEDISKADPENEAANRCLAEAAATQRQAKLAEAEVFARQGQRDKAVQAIAPIKGTLKGQEAKRADEILASVEKSRARQFLEDTGISWAPDVIVGVWLLLLIYVALVTVRWVKRFFRRLDFGPTRTNWRVLPLDDQTKLGTAELVNDAYQRLWQKLPAERDPLLFLNPDIASSTHRVLLDFLRPKSDGPSGTNTGAEFLLQKLERHNPDFFDSAQEVQVKVGGVQLDLLARMLRSFGNWFKAGDPALSGRAFISDDKDGEVTVQLTRSGNKTRFATVMKSAKGKDVKAAREASDGAVFKMLYLLSNRDGSPEEADSAESVRQSTQELLRMLRDGEDRNSATDPQNFQRIAEELKKVDQLLPLETPRKLLWQGIAGRCGGDAAARYCFQDAEETTKTWLQEHGAVTALAWNRTAESYRAQAVYNQGCLEPDPEPAIALFDRALQFTEASDFPGRDSLRILAAIGKTICGARLPWSCALLQSIDADVIATWAKGKDVRLPEASISRRDSEVLDQLVPEFKQAQAIIYLNLATAYPAPVRPRNLTSEQQELLRRASDHFSRSEGAKPVTEYYASRARLCLFKADWPKSREYAAEALKIDPSHEWAIYALAEGYFSDPTLEQPQQIINAARVIETLSKPATLPPLIELVSMLSLPPLLPPRIELAGSVGRGVSQR
jgi:tetratricopeptide (TPR) repeat protein